MRLGSGHRVGSYEIVAPLGAGGMGEVYRARDLKLGREVALKILPDAFASDPDRLARFEREAHTLASLNHPNIAHVYGIEDSAPTPALVMELVEGEDLAERLHRGPLPLDEALAIAQQVAEALEAAHEQGIVHRDLKPANIRLRLDGTVKVLDFGLAKAHQPSRPSPEVSNSPTVVSPAMTELGVILGTAAYMSPEQAAGKVADRRSDLWAFGVVLMEMLTGRTVFAGETVSHVIAEILKAEPDWTRLPANTPPSVRRLLQRCLQKDRRLRLDSGAAAKLELAEGAVAEQPDDGAPKTWRSPWVIRAGLIAAFAGLALVAAVCVVRRGPVDANAYPAARFSVFPPDRSNFYNGLAISPDGQHVAASAVTDSLLYAIWIRPFNGLEFRRVTGTDNGAGPFWSPDGRWIGFFDVANGALKKIPSEGGTAVTLVPSTGPAGGRAASWNSNNQIIFSWKGLLFLVSGNGGTPVQLRVTTQDNTLLLAYPYFLPDGRHFLFFSSRPSQSSGYGLHRGTLDSSESTQILTADSSVAYSAGHLLYIKNDELLAHRIDERTWNPVGSPERIGDYAPLSVYGTDDALVDSRSAETLVMQTSLEPSTPLTWFDRQGRTLGTVQDSAQGKYFWPAISPSGVDVAVHRRDPDTGIWNIWVLRKEQAAFRLTYGTGRHTDSVWSPDGREIAYVTQQNGVYAIQRRKLDDNPVAHEIHGGSADELIVTDWSRNGEQVLYNKLSQPPGIWMTSADGNRTPTLLTDESIVAYGGRFSPDGQWIAYSGVESAGALQVYVRSLRMPNVKFQITSEGGFHPRWRSDSKELYFLGIDGRLKVVELEVSPTTVRAGVPRTLFDLPVLELVDSRSHFAVSDDGQRFLFRPAAGPRNSLTVIQNWTSLLRH